jgi:hypothetical protein
MIRTQRFTATKQLAMPCSVQAASVLAENLSSESLWNRSFRFIGLGSIHAVWSSLNRRCDGYAFQGNRGHISMLLSALSQKSAEDYSNQLESTLYRRSGERRHLAATPR